MRRYIVFIWDMYYPGGGWNDVADSFHSADLATAYLHGRVQGQLKGGHVVDAHTGEVVAEERGELR